jgi:hypothetical protein
MRLCVKRLYVSFESRNRRQKDNIKLDSLDTMCKDFKCLPDTIIKVDSTDTMCEDME